MEWALGAETEV